MRDFEIKIGVRISLDGKATTSMSVNGIYKDVDVIEALGFVLRAAADQVKKKENRK